MTVKLYAMTCGWITADMNMFLAGRPGTIHVPIPSYLIDHPKGLVLFDTGLHPQCGHDARGRLGGMADLFQVHFRKGEDIKSRLEQLDIDADKIQFVINSHLHFDHSGGNSLVPNAKVIIQEREWEAGKIPELIEANGYVEQDYDLGHLVQCVKGEHDLFGDGRIKTIPTFGHTPGHQSLMVRLDSGDIVLTADACYLKETMQDMHLPGLVYSRSQMLDSILAIRKLQHAGARIFYGHDPEFWAGVPQAPRQIV